MLLPIDKTYAGKLRHLRLLKDFKQKAMADLLGLHSQQNYSKLENGQKHFTEEIIGAICEVFRIDRNEFTGGSGSNPKSTDAQNTPNNEPELQQLKSILALKTEITEFQKLTSLVYNKLLLEKEIELIRLKIENLSLKRTAVLDSRQQHFFDAKGH